MFYSCTYLTASVQDSRQEVSSRFFLRIVDHLRGCSLLNDATVLKEDNAVRSVAREANFVRGHEDR